MQFIFIDDARQRNCPRERVGELVAIGGVMIDASRARALERRLDQICRSDFGFPEGEPFKWSPGREHWMRDRLVRDRRRDFFLSVLAAAAELGARAQVTIEDTSRQMATGKAPNHELDVILVALERFGWSLTADQAPGVVIAARPQGDRRDEDKFLTNLDELLAAGTQYSAFGWMALNVLTTPFKNSRLLQLADLVVSCTTALVAGHASYADTVFHAIKALMRERRGSIGGAGLKLHPDYCYVNLYHWLLGDTHYIRGNVGHPLPFSGRPYSRNPMRYAS